MPLRGGSGIKIRILRAMAMGINVVAIEMALAGIEMQYEKNIMIDNGPASLADQTVRLLGNTGMKREIGFAGRKLVENSMTGIELPGRWKTVTWI